MNALMNSMRFQIRLAPLKGAYDRIAGAAAMALPAAYLGISAPLESGYPGYSRISDTVSELVWGPSGRLETCLFVLTAVTPVAAQFGPPPPEPPGTPKQKQRLDITGWWVSVIHEDWRFRMVTAPKGDTVNIHVTSLESADDQTHGLTVDMYNLNVSLGFNSSNGDFIALTGRQETQRFYNASANWGHSFGRRVAAFVSPSFSRVTTTTDSYNSFRITAGLRLSFGADS